ncbi:MAG TPA: LamG-like jellyroll fold domain-containing protein, partial [Verrucomicrobiae bacterium]|nr:LamG-like jellyroll fold domain-containing protein [Verrucomicrobiae bacterium]
EAYFAHVDNILRMAATNGLQIMLDALETGDWMDAARANGTDGCRRFGQYLGERYKDFPNLIWITGNDFQTWRTPADDAVATAVTLGILDRDTNHLQTTELDYFVSQSLDDPNWWPIVSLNSTYTYYPSYAETLEAYNQTNFVPVYFLEAHYEYEDVGGELGTPNVLRRQEYWSLLSGANGGHMYGNYWTWTFRAGWQGYLNSPGVAELAYVKTFFGSRRWYDLVPDQSHALVTDGYGTFATAGLVSANDYATAAKTPDGTLGICYLPTPRPITVDLTQMSGPVTARWFDATQGTYLGIAGSPFINTGLVTFTPPATNSGGDGDWVLVLETQPPEAQPPRVRLTAPVDQATVTGAITVAAVASDNVAVAGVRFKVDGTSLGMEQSLPPYTNVWDTAYATNGLHRLQAIARDTAGNLATNRVTVMVSNSLPAAPTDHLVAAYGFDEGTGTQVHDFSGNANVGTLSNATWTANGRFGSAITFAGNGWITVDDSSSLSPTNQLTLMGWMRPTVAPGTWATVLLKEASGTLSYMLQTDSADRPCFYVTTLETGLQGVVGGSPVPLNDWTHLAGTYDGSQLRLFVNGAEVAAQPLAASILSSAQPLRLGGNSIWGEHLIGDIDEVRIYNRALGGAEIQAAMQAPVAGTRWISLAAPAQDDIQNNGFQLVLTAATPGDYTIETSADLTNWQELVTVTCSNAPVEIIDLDSRSRSHQFYRAKAAW